MVDQVDVRELGAQPVHEVAGGADHRDFVAWLDYVPEQGGAEVAPRNERKLDAAEAREQPENATVAQAQVSACVELAQSGLAVKPDHVVDVGCDNIAVGGRSGDCPQPALHLSEGQPVETKIKKIDAVSTHRGRTGRPEPWRA